jgi:membrane AbrB-like protein
LTGRPEGKIAISPLRLIDIFKLPAVFKGFLPRFPLLPPPRNRRPVSPRLRAFLILLATYALATGAGYLFFLLALPLPWMLGPLISTAVLFLLGASFDVPVRTRPVGQMIVASQVGLSFTSAALVIMATRAPMILTVAVATAVLGFLTARILRALTGLDTVTAFLAAMPGGPVEMANLAKRYGRDPAPVIFTQTLRIAAVVILFPLTIYAIHGRPDKILPLDAAEISLAGMAMMCAGAAASAMLFRVLHLANPFFLGPLAFSAIATASGLALSPFPYYVLAGAQILLGTWLGSTFRRELFTSGGRFVIAAAATTLLLIVMCAAIGVALALVTDIPWETLVLGAAPGGVTEMALTARFLHQDVAMITTFHLVRIFLIIPNIPWVISKIHARGVPKKKD